MSWLLWKRIVLFGMVHRLWKTNVKDTLCEKFGALNLPELAGDRLADRWNIKKVWNFLHGVDQLFALFSQSAAQLQ